MSPDRSMPTRWLLLGLAACVVAGAGYFVFIQQAGVPAVAAGRWSFTIGELSGGLTASQTMYVEADGLCRITIAPERAGKDVYADVVFELRDISDRPEGHVLFRRAVPARKVLERAWYDFEFPPVPDSRGRWYRLSVRAPMAQPGQGITLRAVAGYHYPGGRLFRDLRELPADLVFRTAATEATAWARMMEKTRSGWTRSPGPLLALTLLALGSAGFAMAWGILAYLI